MAWLATKPYPAMADDSQDRQLPATERKIRKARSEGQVARSQDLGHLAAVGAGLALLMAFAPQLTAWLGRMLGEGLRFDAATLAHPASMTERLSTSSNQMLVALLPLGGVIAAGAVLAGVLAGGWNFTLAALEPKFAKVNPLEGLKRMFSGQQLTNTLKVCVLALLLGAIGAAYLESHLTGFSLLITLPLPAAMAEAGALLRNGVLLILIALAAFALVDVPLQRQMLLRRLRMSFEEVKKEHKEVEGNAEVKAKMKLKMRELANRRMLAAVPNADLVVMNPSHFAVALKYDEATMSAPRVLAKGADLMAFRIRDAAQGAKVPVLQSPPLARALYKYAEIDQEVPAALFSAVAQVLAWVFQLRAAVAAGRPMTAPLPAVEVPEGMDPANPRVEPEL